jgi:cysteine peptidase C11 family protein
MLKQVVQHMVAIIVFLCTAFLHGNGDDTLFFHELNSGINPAITSDRHISENIKITPTPAHENNKKEWTFIVYMAADNDLRGFAARNIKQMAAIGSNEHINIVIHLDIRIAGNRKVTRRYYIEKGRIIHVNAYDPDSQQMDSGAPETLISCCEWAITQYPARNHALIFWNHGSGAIDYERGHIFNAAKLFSFNPTINKYELDRSIGFFDFINAINTIEQEERGICWDDSTGNYLTNQSLDYALNIIQQRHLNGNKFSLIGFDACLMSMLEISNIIKKYAQIMVSSQEVELGTGWNYALALAPFQQSSLTAKAFAAHLVNAYEQTYQQITNDYTLSALDLGIITALEDNLNTVATLLIECLRIQQADTVKRAIKASRDKLACTHFDEVSYIDLHHFYSNLLINISKFEFNHQMDYQRAQELIQYINQGCIQIEQIAFANTTGGNLSRAKGISIYFPERKIHSSYRKTLFGATNNWLTFLTHYLGA